MTLAAFPGDLFVADIQALARQSLRTALTQTDAPRARPSIGIWPLFLRQRLHRETALSMHMFGCFATVRMPYIDNDVVDALFAMPASMKMGDTCCSTPRCSIDAQIFCVW